MKHLIVNADDLGFTPDINAAIEELHRAGRVTNASLMVDGEHLEDALQVIRRNPRLAIGLHLDLCPVVGFYRLPYQQMRANLASPEMQAVVAEEVIRQITRFQELGLEFTHMDGHRHFHALPELFRVVVETAAARGMKTIRLSKHWVLPRTPSVFWDDTMESEASTLLAQHGIAYANNMIYGWKDYSAADFGPGWNELIVHVGYNDEHYLREYKLVSSDDFRQRVEDSGAQLKSFRDLVQ
jgi:predicted glycoside hydrolase/deacetylase ChbG (UPF0249 family)